MSCLRLNGIARRFGPTIALEGVNLEVRPGEVHALIGENGAGKSTLMKILAGELPADRGTMEVDGRPYHPRSPRDGRHAGIGLVHQELSLFPHLSVTENLLMGVEATRGVWLDRRANRGRAAEMLGRLQRADIAPERRVSDLPLSSRQVVEIARLLAARARILLLDEPTSSLQQPDVERLFHLVRLLRDEGAAVIYISHFIEEVRRIADRYTVLRDGRSVATGALEAVSDADLITHMVGRQVGELYPPRGRCEAGPALLDVQGLRAPPRLADASFELRAGEVLGIAGLAGSGRTEMVRALFGLDRAAGGRIRVGGHDVARLTPRAQIGRGLGYLSEDRKDEGLAPTLSIADNVTLTGLARCSRAGWLSLPLQREQARERMEQVSVKARSPEQPVAALSGGNQQKVALARLLHQDAGVLLLDEPTRGIDIASKAEIYRTITELAASGRAVLLVSSQLPELFGLCDRLAVMRRGRLSPARPIDEWTPESALEWAVGAEASAMAG